MGDTFPFNTTSDEKEVYWEESTDGGGEALPTLELSAQLSLDQVTMENFPRERSLAVVQTQYNMTTVLSGSPPQPASGLTLLPPPPHPPLGPPRLHLPPHTSSGPPPPPPPPVNPPRMEKTAAYAITTLYQYNSEEKTQEVENDVIPNLNTKFRQESSFKPPKLQQEPFNSFEAPDSNRYQSTTMAPTAGEEEIEYQTWSMSHRLSTSSMASTTSTSTAPDHCSPQPPLDRIDDNEPDTLELSSPRGS